MRPKPYLSQQPVDDFGLGMPNHMYTARLDADTPLALTVPGDAGRWKAVLEFSGADVWVAVNDTATVITAVAPPVEIAFAETNSRLNPRCIEVQADDVLSFISRTASTLVSVAFYAVGSNN